MFVDFGSLKAALGYCCAGDLPSTSCKVLWAGTGDWVIDPAFYAHSPVRSYRVRPSPARHLLYSAAPQPQAAGWSGGKAVCCWEVCCGAGQRSVAAVLWQHALAIFLCLPKATQLGGQYHLSASGPPVPSGPALTEVFARSRGTWRSCLSSRLTTSTRRPLARAWTALSWRRALPLCLQCACTSACPGRGGLHARLSLCASEVLRSLLLALAPVCRCVWW